MGPIRGMVTSSLLLKINEHTAISRKGNNTERAEWSKVLGEKQREKGANLFLAKQYQLHISNARRGIVLQEDNSSLYELSKRNWLLRNTFGSKTFSYPKANIPDSVSMSFASV